MRITIPVIYVLYCNLFLYGYGKDEDPGPVIPPSKCEVCKYLATELKDRLEETGKTKEVLEIGHGIDPKKKKRIKYNTAELRLIEALNDPHICDKILDYNIHKERSGSLRFAKGQSETFQTLHNLVNKGVKVVMDIPYELWNNTPAEVTQLHKEERDPQLRDKGVKVDLGIPYELWDKPSAEVTQLQRECFTVVERYEEDIENWYFEHQDRDIIDYLCREHVLRHDDQSCLDEVYVPKGKTEEIEDSGDEKPEKKKAKKKKAKKNQKGETENHTEL